MKDSHVFEKVIEGQLKVMREARRSFRRYNAEAVHVLRVAASRTDFALKFFGRPQDKARIMKIRARLKEARRIMGVTRNFDILLTRAKRYLKDSNISPSERKTILGAIQSRRAVSHQAFESMLKAPQFNALLKELGSIKNKHLAQDLPGIIKGPFKKTLTGILKYRGKQIHARDLHEIRIAFKKLRYACNFLEDIEPGLHEAQKYIGKFQDLLGERQDAITSLELLPALDRRRTGKFKAWEKSRIKDCHNRFELLWKRSFLKSTKFEGLYSWSRHYPLIFMSF